MSSRTEIARLQTIAELMLDHRLSGLKVAAHAKAKSEAASAALAGTPEADGLEGAAAALVGLTYQRWADARRAEINLQLALQTRDWLDAQSHAREAFGKSQALNALAARLKASRDAD